MFSFRQSFTLFFCSRWLGSNGNYPKSCISTISYSCALPTSQCTGWWLSRWLQTTKLLLFACPSSSVSGTCSLVSLSLGRYVFTEILAFHFLFVLFAYSRSKHSLIIMTCYQKFAAYPCVVEVVLLVLSRRLDNLWYFHLSSWRQGYSTYFRRWECDNSQDIP